MPYSPGPIHWIGSSQPPLAQNLQHDTQAETTLEILYAALSGKATAGSGPYRGGLLYGSPGTGKSTALARFARPVLNVPLPTTTWRVRHHWLDRQAIWTQASELIEDIKHEIALSQRNDFADFGDAFSASGIARRVPMLFIDDLGVEADTGYSRAAMESLIDARYRDRGAHQTWFTTNLSLPELVDRYSNRTVSRLCEMCELVEWRGEDRRILALSQR